MPPKPVVLLDLDRTLFDTDRFMADLLQLLHTRYDKTAQQIKTDYAKYHTYVGELRYYDLFKHMQAYGISPQQIRQAIQANMGKTDYLYADVPDFLRFLNRRAERIEILTFGEDEFQQLKYRMAPQLRDYKCITVLQPKPTYIAAHYSREQGILIDDREVGPLPAGFRQLLISRYRASGAYHSLSAIQADWAEQAI